jgi:hypothetical protein
MMMSVYRQGRPTAQMDHLVCLKLAKEAYDLDLITHAFLHETHVLTALDQTPAIVKPQEAGDDGHSYESLYDTAITMRDFRRMKAHKAQSPDGIGAVLYEVELVFHIDFNPRVLVNLKARDEIEAKATLTRLLKEPEFRQRLASVFCDFVFQHPHTSLATPGFLKIDDPAPADAPEWEIPSDGD